MADDLRYKGMGTKSAVFLTIMGSVQLTALASLACPSPVAANEIPTTQSDVQRERPTEEITKSTGLDNTPAGGTVPGGTVPGGTLPGGTVPGGTVPGGTLPGGTVPGTVPGGTLPGGTGPGGTVPGGTLH